MSRQLRGALPLHLDASAAATAPASGVRLGVGQDGPVTLRLFRPAGTRVVLATRVLPAQLLAVRAAAAGTPVHVLTRHPQLWEPLLPPGTGRSGASGVSVARHTVGAFEPSPDVGGGPTLVVDDRQADSRAPGEPRPWLCRVEVRPPASHRAAGELSELAAFAYADLTILGTVAAELVPAIARVFELSAASVQPLARLDGASFGLLRRGRVDYVALDPVPAEARLLERARGATPPQRAQV